MQQFKVSCHCGEVLLLATFPDGIKGVKRCNCSICRRKGAIMAYTKIENVQIEKGADKLSSYAFHSHTAKHYFCSNCGIYTHHQTRFDPDSFGINTGCIEGLDLETLTDVVMSDGVNHTSDA